LIPYFFFILILKGFIVGCVFQANTLTKVIALARKNQNVVLLASCAEAATIIANTETAMNVLNDALELDPSCTCAIIQKVVLQAATTQDASLAIEHLQSAIAVDPASQQAHLYLARMHVQNGDTEAADEHFTKAAELGFRQQNAGSSCVAMQLVRSDIVLECLAKNIAELKVIEYINLNELEAAPL
jgi:Tfp pilus assembly protein PilF